VARARYTKDQIAFLREWCPQMRLDELTEAFNYVFDQARSESSIRDALNDRKITCGRRGGFKKGDRWQYTDKHLDFLREGYKAHRLPELTRRFNERFGLDKTAAQIKSTLKNHKIRCGRKTGFKVGERRQYSDEQLAFLRENYPKMDCNRLAVAFNEEFGTDKTPDQIHGTCTRYKIHSGRDGRFGKGQKVWNDGLAGKGVCRPNRGSFRKGDVPANTLPMYTERINKDGFVEIKVPVPNPYTGAKTRFMHKQVWVWEQANGPVPEDHVIRFLDGDKTNCSPDNLGLFTRAESLEMTRLGFSEVEKEAKPAMAALGQLSARTRKAERDLHGYSTPGEVRGRVLELGQQLAQSGIGAFSARQIQQAGWPHVEGHKAVKLGISLALSVLVKQGQLRRVDRGLYATVDGEREVAA
jgi:hypothetical protein